MARLCPGRPSPAALTPGVYTEIELLERLERGLSNAFTLFHNVEWCRADDAHDQHGEIDIVVVNQDGDVLSIELKTGEVEFREDGIFKTYRDQRRNVTAQVRLQHGALRARLDEAGLRVPLKHLLVLPDVRVLSPSVQWPRERILDSTEVPDIVSRVTRELGPGRGDGARAARVIAFFENRFLVQPDVSALAGRLQHATTRLSAGLATWVPRIEVPSGVLRVVGTAGSGKTQLALRLLREADARGQRAAYVCFNRALADHMARVVPTRVVAETFHEFALRIARRSGFAVDFAQPDAFARLTALCLDIVADSPPSLDLILVDEVQDLQPDWVQALLAQLREDGRAVLLEDPQQQLYPDREPFDIPGAVRITSHENFRSPRVIVKLVNALRLGPEEIDSQSAYEGEFREPIVCTTEREMLTGTVRAVKACLTKGFAVEDIAVVSLRGRDHSLVQHEDRLGACTLRRFTGHYDDGGAAVWTEGKLLVDTVRRFKGQSAPAIVLTECDSEALDEMTRRLLFVGLTRARVHVEWVMSSRMAAVIEQALSV